MFVDLKARLNLLHALTPQVHLMDEFDILQIVGEGWFGKILLVEHKATDTEMVLKGSFHCAADAFQLHLTLRSRVDGF
jgi:hypothetical protein